MADYNPGYDPNQAYIDALTKQPQDSSGSDASSGVDAFMKAMQKATDPEQTPALPMAASHPPQAPQVPMLQQQPPSQGQPQHPGIQFNPGQPIQQVKPSDLAAMALFQLNPDVQTAKQRIVQALAHPKAGIIPATG